MSWLRTGEALGVLLAAGLKMPPTSACDIHNRVETAADMLSSEQAVHLGAAELFSQQQLHRAAWQTHQITNRGTNFDK